MKLVFGLHFVNFPYPHRAKPTAVLTIAENQPIGTFVGEFNATDPEGGSIFYSLVDGNGSSDNHLFTLDDSGSLHSSVIFDYENNASSYSIRVKAKDEYNATTEGNFIVTLEDVYEPSRENHSVDLNSTVSLEMIWVEPGTFTMGSPVTETGRGVDETQHEVTLTRGFYLGKYEVTQAQYEAVMTGNSDGLSATPSNWQNNPNRPVEKVSYDDAQVFLSRLNEREAGNIPAGWAYVLPTEAQWEYACRAGTTTAYSWGDSITTDNANYSSSGYSQTRDVGLYSANAWGFLTCMEMCGSGPPIAYAAYSSGAVTDPEGPLRARTVFFGAGLARRTRFAPAFGLPRCLPPKRPHIHDRLPSRFQKVNKPPTDLNSTEVLTIAENQPVGTIVGEFSATDPEGDTITYQLISGEGFSLEPDGTLKTATTFDYENNASTYTISVQAKDELNATTEGNFTIEVNDEFEWGQPKYIINTLFGMELLWVEPGTILDINITEGFYLGKYEVTQQEYIQVMGTNPGWDEGNSELGDKLPVEWISKVYALSFCSELNEDILGLNSDYEFTLPSDKEWEYACRAGTTTNFFWGDENEIFKLEWRRHKS